MGKINVLGFDVANLIAAGEVVDRPASVVKELLENALDAGATAITVEIQNGGVSFIRVSDNGCGMDAEDLPVAILRHATSKIKEADDLDGIATLGFRGEALAAISSVAKVRIFSKVADAEYGALLSCDGGSVVSLTETGCADGTTVIVEELFFNVPARRKFLKKDSTETVAVTGVVEKIALSVPSVSIRYIADGEVKFMTAGDGNLLNTVYALFGRDTAKRTIAVDRTDGGIRVHGFVSAPDQVRSNRNMENFFINGRYVKSRTAGAALEQAYVSRIPQEKFPFCVLNIELNQQAVDVNVHPAKLEVKFSNERAIFEAVYYAVLGALESESARPELRITSEKKDTPGPESFGVAKPSRTPVSETAPTKPKPSGNFWVSTEEARKLYGAFVQKGPQTVNTQKSQVRISAPGTIAAANHMPMREEKTGSEDISGPKESSVEHVTEIPTVVKTNDTESVSSNEASVSLQGPSPSVETVVSREETADIPSCAAADASTEEKQTENCPEYIIIGEVYNCYVIVQLEDRIILIDKHAAHERIIFDELCENMRKRSKTAQVLMFPIEVPLREEEIAALEDVRDKVEAIGFSFRRTAHGIEVTEIPTEIARDAAPEMIAVLAGRICEGTGTVESTEAEYFEARLYQASCKAAIKGGRLYSTENIKWLCDRILRTPQAGESAVKTCPHGRPIAFEIRKSSIERQFSRLL